MNIQELEIIKQLYLHGFSNQRELATFCRCSLGMVNRCLQSLESRGYLTSEKQLTTLSLQLLEKNKPQRAVILAAGVGMRMLPMNMEQPKAMLDVYGEILIERLIRQLHEVGIQDIYVVVGFMKEAFEYLIDEFGVELIVNPDYASCNNLHSLALVKDMLSNSYILPCDIWCKENPFSSTELYSWYMVKDSQDQNSEIRVNRMHELIRIRRGEMGNSLVGICYITGNDGEILKHNIEEISSNYLYDHAFWEEALYRNDKMITLARVVSEDQVIEINTFCQLRELGLNSEQIKSYGISFACSSLNISQQELKDVHLLKKGMTNQSFLFTASNRKYVLRLPRPNAGHFVNWQQEKTVYEALKGQKISDDLLALDTQTGCKISRYFENARSCRADSEDDIAQCMTLLRNIHEKGLQVPHHADMFARIRFYEDLWQGRHSAYRDYEQTCDHVLSLRAYIEQHRGKSVLIHMDTALENFLFFENTDGEEELRLIDWEHAAMQDPHVEIAMFCINALYRKDQIDHVIDLYFENQCSREIRAKIYCYVAVCGLMWSNWCEYQMQNGAEFGEYSLKQYRYAKKFYRYAEIEISGLQCDEK